MFCHSEGFRIHEINTDTNLRGTPEVEAPPLPILLLNFLTAADKVILFFTCLEKVEEPGGLWSSAIITQMKSQGP